MVNRDYSDIPAKMAQAERELLDNVIKDNKKLKMSHPCIDIL